jgi:hypothetical protein
MFEGYYRNDQATALALDPDGWYRTGDIVRHLGEREIEIVDRRKDLFKLAHGEYVSPQRVEFAVLSASALIEQMCVVGHRHASFLVALVCPRHEAVARALAINLASREKEGGHNNTISASTTTSDSISVEDLVKRKDVMLMILNEIWNISKFTKLRTCETIKRIALIAAPFSVQEGTLTHTHKLCRYRIEKRYSVEIDALYDGEIVVVDETETNSAKSVVMNETKTSRSSNPKNGSIDSSSSDDESETKESFYQILLNLFPTSDISPYSDLSLLGQDFLSVGGNSITAVQFVEAVNATFGPVISLSSIFQQRLSLAHILNLILATRHAKKERNGDEVIREMQLIEESLDEVDIFHNDLRSELLLGDLCNYRVCIFVYCLLFCLFVCYAFFQFNCLSHEQYPPPSSPRVPRTVLLTGCTGFLGAFLLNELVNKVSHRIV